ncbi:hypothetical protein F4604DRAFT_1685160 [Suillus subluteus]|nr:hypothetical protein F4604DRAFT_1685160 [Suillus subluteus]
MVLTEGLKHNTDGIQRALTFYDINCQYHKHLKDCIADNPFLDIWPELEIIPGIGLWHVHGHQDSCYVHYTSNFINSATRIDGEIMETLWVPLNDCEGKALCHKFRQVVKGVANSKVAFEKLDQTADAN